MFLKSPDFRGGYTRHGQQYAHGRFLVVFSGTENYPEPHPETGRVLPMLYAAVRTVRLTQCGHWMMGSLRLGKDSVSVSGAYGGDGLPMDMDQLSEEQRALLSPVPFGLAVEFWSGGGWNSAGSEAQAMREWATAELKRLRRRR
jgi:hypothetical protein